MTFDGNEQDTNATPDVTPAPAAVPPAGISELVTAGPQAAPAPTPSAAPTTDAAAVQAQMAPFQAKEKAAYESAADLATKPLPSTDDAGPHARLRAMIVGLAQAAGQGGVAIATGGREGGVRGVAEYQQQQAELKMRQTAAAQAQRNQQIQNQLMVGQTNHQLGQNLLLMHAIPNDIKKSDLEVKEAQQGFATGEFNLAKGYQDLAMSQHYDLTDLGQRAAFFQANRLTDPASQGETSAGAGPTGAAPAGASLLATPLQINSTRAAATSAVTQARATGLSDDPKSPQFNQQFADFVKASDDFTKADKPTFAQNRRLQFDLNTVANLTSGQEKAATATTARFKSEQEAGAQALYNRVVPKNSAGQPTEDFATWQARSTKEAEVAAQQGDPTTLGAMAADGLISIPAVALARQLDKKGFQKLIEGADAEAKRNGVPEIVVNGRPTGHYFNATAATQQYDYVKEFNNPNSKSQQSIGAANTFLEHTSDLLDINAEYRRTGNKILNTPLNKIASVFGNEEYARVVAAITPVKTEYDNALKAGFAPTVEDQKAVEGILDLRSSPAAIEAGALVMAHTILRRMDTTNQGYKTHTGDDYPNMITPDARVSLDKMKIPAGPLQTGGSFGGPKQVVNLGSTAAAPTLPPAPQGTVNIRDSKGGYHNLPQASLAAARQRDPKLTVIQ